jgi:serine/threonine protein kinase
MSTPKPNKSVSDSDLDPAASKPGDFTRTLVASNDPTQPAFVAPPINRVPGYPFLTAPQAADELGRLGEYRILAKLGEGGMGYVFRGEDPALQRLVALKVMRPEVAAKEKAAERFLREGRAAAGLKSDHIITIYQVGRANDVPFLAMEFLEGESLEDWISRKRRVVTLVHALHIARDTLRGLATAHDKGLIHRDIKPANLWIEKGTSRIIILDFGLTRTSDADAQLTQEGAVVGTPAYMAPEQAAGSAVDVRADLFSVGTVIYHLLAGTNPFARDSIVATLGAVSFENQPPLMNTRPDIPKEYSDFIDRLMAKRTDGRPANARVALAELTAIDRQLNAARTGTMPALNSTSTVPVYVPEVEPPPPIDSAGRKKSRRDIVKDAEVVEAGFEVVEDPIPVKESRLKKVNVSRKAAPSHAPKRKPNNRTWLYVGGGIFVALAIGSVIALNGKKSSEPVPAAETATTDTGDRKTAELILNAGGKVTIGGTIYSSGQNLPGGSLKITGVVQSSETNANTTDDDLERYRSLTELVDLEVYGPITDAGLAKLSGFPRAPELRRLGVGSARLTDDGLKVLPRFLNLRSLLIVQSPGVNGRGLVHLKGMGIESLDLSRTDLRDAELVHLKGLPALKSLELNGTKIAEDGLKQVGGMTQLVRLKLLMCPQLSDAGFRHLTGLQQLQVLGYSSVNKALSGASLESVGKLKMLKELDISLIDMGVRDAGQIAGLDRIERLSLVQTDLDDSGFEHFFRLKYLKYLNVANNRITSGAIQRFRANRGLVRLKSDFSDE